jgi:hypothetical protein
VKRILPFLIGALLLGSPSRIWAQKQNDPDWVYIPQSVAGTTFCVSGGVRTVIDMQVSDDQRILAITRAHELIHQRQMKDRSLCHPSWELLLPMETEAYCDADAVMAIELFQIDSTKIYLAILGALENQFFGALPVETVIGAWYNRCGKRLGITAPDGTAVKK